MSALVLTMLMSANAVEANQPAKDAPVDATQKAVSYGYRLVNTTSRTLTNVELSTDAPVLRTSGQDCCERLSASENWQLAQDLFGNQTLRLRVGSIPPYGRMDIRVEALLRNAWSPNTSDAPGNAYLEPQRFVEVDHPKIRSVAESLRELNGPMATARRVYGWVTDHVQDSGYLRDDRGAHYALEHGRGDCTEHMYLFVALARANGIPARPMAGYIVKGNGILRARDYHNWAEFYANGAWHIADPHQGVFNDGYSDYVATRIMGNPAAAAAGSERFKSTAAGLEVKMR